MTPLSALNNLKTVNLPQLNSNLLILNAKLMKYEEIAI